MGQYLEDLPRHPHWLLTPRGPGLPQPFCSYVLGPLSRSPSASSTHMSRGLPCPFASAVSSQPETDQPQADAGSFVRGPASRAESNRPVVIPNRSVSVLSACSVGPLTLKDRLRREFHAFEPISVCGQGSPHVSA